MLPPEPFLAGGFWSKAKTFEEGLVVIKAWDRCEFLTDGLDLEHYGCPPLLAPQHPCRQVIDEDGLPTLRWFREDRLPPSVPQWPVDAVDPPTLAQSLTQSPAPGPQTAGGALPLGARSLSPGAG